VYEKLDVDGLKHVAFKDVGVDRNVARDLTDAAHADGRTVLLELADLTDRGQEQGMRLAADLGVDRVVARWRADFAEMAATNSTLEYWPFVGTLSGSPLQLAGTPAELSQQAKELSGHAGVDGLVLMPYRQRAYDPATLLACTTEAADVPVLVAGGVRGAQQIGEIRTAGGWGFTIGGAALADRHVDPASVSRRTAEILRLCQPVPVPRSGSGRAEEKVT
jgi:hypothetical protein